MPRDASTGEYQPEAARLAAAESADAETDDATDRGAATPIGRDEPFFFADRKEFTDEPPRADIDEWKTEYDENPLLKRPTQLFVEDVFEPGYKIRTHPKDPTVDPETFEEPTVPDSYPNAQYHGLDLSAALERWCSRCGITADSFEKDLTVVLKQALRDAYGRRGTGLIEHAYGDYTERQRLIGLRPFPVDDVTAYTRAGKAILLRPDDDADSLRADDSAGFEPRRAPTLSLRDRSRKDIPETAAGKTAAYVQFDDIYGRSENEEIAFALDDVTMFARDPDTGAVFGRPDTATVVTRAKAIRDIYQDVDQGVKNAAWNSIIANVNTDNQEEAKKMLSGLDPNNPESVSVTNTDPDITTIDGQTPDVVNLIQQQIEYIISALPVSLYRVGFEGDINRDVTGEQSDDYADALSAARQWVESQLRPVLELKACEFMTGHAHPADAEAGELYGEPSDVPDITIEVRPSAAQSPLESEHFQADAFAQLMQGLKAAAPGGQVSQLVDAEAIIGLIPGWESDEVLPGAVQDAAEMGELAPLDEADPEVREQFAASMGLPDSENLTNGETDDATLANRYSEGDIVDTPDGIGVIAAAVTETIDDDALAETENVPDRIEASSDSPMYGVVTENAGQPVRFYRASELSMSEIDTDVDPIGAVADDEEAAAALCECETQEAALNWRPPKSWRESDTPARLIGLKAFASMGGDFDGCEREMRGNVTSPDRFCGAFLDWIYGGYDFWRGDSFLPGD